MPISNSIQFRSPQGAFANEPFLDFKVPENARAMRAALDEVASRLGQEDAGIRVLRNDTGLNLSCHSTYKDNSSAAIDA